jgi:hypothetical protein
LTVPSCPSYPSLPETFSDSDAGADADQGRCMQRAADYYGWCGASTPVTATYYSGDTQVATTTYPATQPPAWSGTCSNAYQCPGLAFYTEFNGYYCMPVPNAQSDFSCTMAADTMCSFESTSADCDGKEQGARCRDEDGYWAGRCHAGATAHACDCVTPDPGTPTLPDCDSGWPSMGTFSCDGYGQQHQTICGCYPPGYMDTTLWADIGGGCFTHTTGASCITDCGASWGSMGSFWCDGAGLQHQQICGCYPPSYNDPSYWTDDGGNCYEHYTGTRCW